MMEVKTARGGGSGSRARSRLREMTWRGRKLRPTRTIKNGGKAWVDRELRVPLNWPQKAKLKAYIRSLTRRTVKGRVWGVLTGKQAEIGCYLVATVNTVSGKCCPSYAAIRAKIGCCNRTITGALDALEAAGIMRRIHRIVRRRSTTAGMEETLVQRASNGYVFVRQEALLPLHMQTIKRDTVLVDRPRDQPVNRYRKHALQQNTSVGYFHDATSWRGNRIPPLKESASWLPNVDITQHPAFSAIQDRIPPR